MSVAAVTSPVPSIVHYRAEEPFTKYEMCLIFARILGLPHGHIIPNTEPAASATVNRPKDCKLDIRATEALGVPGGLDQCIFEEWWSSYLQATN